VTELDWLPLRLKQGFSENISKNTWAYIFDYTGSLTVGMDTYSNRARSEFSGKKSNGKAVKGLAHGGQYQACQLYALQPDGPG